MNYWRLICSKAAGAARNMAVDEVLLRSVSSTEAAIVRLYGWSSPSISIGYAQKAKAFENKGLTLVRRISGGRAVLHDRELTYAVACGAMHPLAGLGVLGAYREISGAIIAALNAVGVMAELTPRKSAASTGHASCFHAPSSYEVTVRGAKMAGSAQKRLKGAFLQHGSIIMSLDRRLFEHVFGNGASGSVASVDEHSTATAGELSLALTEALKSVLGSEFREDTLHADEELIAKALEKEKYSDVDWNLRGRAGLVESL